MPALPHLRTTLGRAAALAAAFISLGCYSTYSTPAAGQWTEQKTIAFGATAPTLLEVHLRHGHVLVQHGDTLACDVEICVRAADEATARAQARAVEPVLEHAPHRLQLRLSHPPGASLDAIEARYRLRVPPDIGLRVLTLSAPVAVRGYRGAIEAQTDSGEIQARPDGGSCRLATISAPIRLEGQFEAAVLATETGDIAVILPAHPPLELDLQTESGAVTLDMVETMRMHLRYETHVGALHTEFPVAWRVEGAAQGERKLFEGVVGEGAEDEIVRASVRSRAGRFELRKLPAGPGPGPGPEPGSGPGAGTDGERSRSRSRL